METQLITESVAFSLTGDKSAIVISIMHPNHIVYKTFFWINQVVPNFHFFSKLWVVSSVQWVHRYGRCGLSCLKILKLLLAVFECDFRVSCSFFCSLWCFQFNSSFTTTHAKPHYTPHFLWKMSRKLIIPQTKRAQLHFTAFKGCYSRELLWMSMCEMGGVWIHWCMLPICLSQWSFFSSPR